MAEQNRRALVCGASSGIGKEVALELSRRGVQCILLARRTDRLIAVQEEIIDNNGPEPILLVGDLEELDWSDSVKEAQKHWIGRSEGATVHFKVADNQEQSVEVFTTRPDTLHGVSFMVLAPEHALVQSLTTEAQKNEVEAYIHQASLKSERDRQGDKSISELHNYDRR